MATNLILFVSPDYVKQATPMGRTVDDDVLAPCILNAQERHILPTLGTDLYDKIKKDVTNDNATGTYLVLLQTYIQPCLVQYAFSEVIPHLRSAIAHNSVTTASGEQASPASEADVRQLIHRADSLGAFHKERMQDWLCSRTDLPEYNSNTYPDLNPTRRNYSQGLNLDPNYESQTYAIAKQLLGLKT